MCDLPLLPALLALSAASLFAIGIQSARLGIRRIDVETATLIQIGTSTALYWLATPFYLEWWYVGTVAALLFATTGLFRPVLTSALELAATRLVGATVSSTLASTSPLFALGFGVVLLGETLILEVGFGTLAIVAGIVVLSSRGSQVREFPWWALLLPVAAAFLRSFAHALAKIGLEEVPSAAFAGLVSHTVSLLVALIVQRYRGPATLARMLRPGWWWLVGTGFCYAVAVLSVNMALKCGDLVLVAPIVATSPLFSLLLGRFVFRESELDSRAMLAVALVVPGVAAIALRG